MAENTSAIEGVKETVKTVVYALLIAGIFRTLFFQPFWIPSGSMKNPVPVVVRIYSSVVKVQKILTMASSGSSVLAPVRPAAPLTAACWYSALLRSMSGIDCPIRLGREDRPLSGSLVLSVIIVGASTSINKLFILAAMELVKAR